MINLELELRGTSGLITAVCEIYDNPLAQFWVKMLQENLESKKIFKKHACFLGWINNKVRTWNVLCDEINQNLANLNAMFPHKVNKIIINPDNFDSNFFNYTHQIFAELLGLKDDVSTEFKNSNIKQRWEIVKLNHLSHELQAYIENIKHADDEIMRPFLNCHFYDGIGAVIPEELNQYFTIGSKWGEIYIGSIDVGKNYYDAFNDNDSDVDDEHLMNFSTGTGEFNIHFSEYRFKPDRMEKFKKWLEEKNLDINNKKLRMGTGKVGIFKYIKNYEALSRQEVLEDSKNGKIYKKKTSGANFPVLIV